MSTVERLKILSPEEYFEGERQAEIKHEYVAGQVYAMVGTSKAHNLIAGNLYVRLRQHLDGGPCKVYMSDVKVRAADAFYYPDVLVTCDPAERDRYVSSHPVLVVEVASPSTEIRDALDKRVRYQAIASLKEYVLIAQSRLEVQIYRRISAGSELETYTEGDCVHLKSLALDVPMTTIYDSVEPEPAD